MSNYPSFEELMAGMVVEEIRDSVAYFPHPTTRTIGRHIDLTSKDWDECNEKCNQYYIRKEVNRKHKTARYLFADGSGLWLGMTRAPIA